jgi:DNA-binding NarL/FixJ family response regulator
MSEVCRALGDEEACGLESAAARAEFQRLGALPDLARLEAPRLDAARAGALSPREVEVLRLIAGGHTNKGIANALHLSERTIDRHVSNILGKLGVPSRAAAIAYGFSHQLL